MVAKGKRAGKKWHFLTPNDRHLLSTGPDLPRKRTYSGKGPEKERKRYLGRYNKVRREAHLHARGALEDLWFLAKTADKDWLIETFAETRPIQGAKARALSRALGASPPTFTYLERFLEALAAKVAWEHVPYVAEAPGARVASEYPEFLIERLTTALQVGINSVPGLKRDVDIRLRPPTALLEEWEALGVPSEKKDEAG